MNRLAHPFTVAVLAAAALSSTPSSAGEKTEHEVVVQRAESGWAYGSLGSARANPGTELIGCSVSRYSTGSPFVYCHAADKNGVYVACYSSSEQIAQVVQTMSADAYLSFSWRNWGECSYVNINHDSAVRPSAP